MTRPHIEVVHVGSACRDIAPEDPRGWRIGGGVMYAALTTARLGLRTAAVVGVDSRGRGRGRTDDARRGRRRHPPRGPVRGSRSTTTSKRRTVVCRRASSPGFRCPWRPCRRRGWLRPAGRSCRLPARSATTGRGSSPRTRMSPSRGRGSCATCAPASRCADCRRVHRRSSSAPISSVSAATTFREMSRCWTCERLLGRGPTCWSPRAPRAVS